MNNHSANSYEVTERRKMQKVKLGKICEITMGQSPESQYYNVLAQGLPFFQGNADFGERHPFVRVWCTNPKKTSDVGAILMSVRAPIGALNLVNVKCAIGRGLVSLKPNSKCMLKYLLYALKSKVEVLKSMGTGSTFKAISKPIVEELEIPLPPIEEQRAIAEKLDKVSQLVDKRKEQLQQLDQLVKSQFISFFGSTDLSDEKKSNVRIGDVAEIVGGSTPKTDIEEYWNGEYFWITPAELKDDSYMIKTTIRKLTKAGVESCSLKKMPVNTVLLSSRAPIGKVAITGVEMYCNQGFKNIICSNKLQPTFIYFLLKYNTKYLNSLGRGATFKEISKSIVENIKIPLPPMEPQNQFAEFVEKVEKLKEKVNNSLTHLNLLKQSLMQQYFG